MTMNVASALALVLCLTVTSSQSGTWNNVYVAPISELSFVTEKENEVSFERNDIRLVTLANDNTVTVEAEEVVETETKEYKNRWNLQLSEEEIDLLAKILWVEARGESEAGQQAVVEVIFNRIISEDFPDSLYDVLSEKDPVQFASWKLRDTAEPTEKEYESIYAVLNGQTSIVKKDTVYFATKKLTRNLDLKIGGHYFCY